MILYQHEITIRENLRTRLRRHLALYFMMHQILGVFVKRALALAVGWTDDEHNKSDGVMTNINCENKWIADRLGRYNMVTTFSTVQ